MKIIFCVNFHFHSFSRNFLSFFLNYLWFVFLSLTLVIYILDFLCTFTWKKPPSKKLLEIQYLSQKINKIIDFGHWFLVHYHPFWDRVTSWQLTSHIYDIISFFKISTHLLAAFHDISKTITSFAEFRKSHQPVWPFSTMLGTVKCDLQSGIWNRKHIVMLSSILVVIWYERNMKEIERS